MPRARMSTDTMAMREIRALVPKLSFSKKVLKDIILLMA